MKVIKNAIALMVVASMVFAVCSCSKKDAASESSTETTVAVETEAVSAEDSKYTLEGIYGRQLPYYLNHQYYFEGKEVPLCESNYYFIQAYSELSSYAPYQGIPTTMEGKIDLTALVDPADPSQGTWGDFFVEYAETKIENTNILVTLAEEKGIEITDEDRESMETYFNNLQTEQVDASGLTLDEYLNAYFGGDCTKEKLLEVMRHIRLSELYMKDYVEDFEVDESVAMVPNVRYALFYAPAGSSEEVMNSQKELCQELLDSCTSLDIFSVEAQIWRSNGSVYEYGDEIAVEKGVMVPEFEAWAYDPSRKEGDIEMIQTEAYGYFVVGYLGLTEIPYESKASLALDTLNEEVQQMIVDKKYDFYTNDEYTGVPEEITPIPEYSNITVYRDGEERPKDYTNIVLISILGVIAGALIGAGIYGSVSSKKTANASASINEEKKEIKKKKKNKKKKK